MSRASFLRVITPLRDMCDNRFLILLVILTAVFLLEISGTILKVLCFQDKHLPVYELLDRDRIAPACCHAYISRLETHSAVIADHEATLLPVSQLGMIARHARIEGSPDAPVYGLHREKGDGLPTCGIGEKVRIAVIQGP